MSLDRVSNMLSALKNASMAGRTFVETYHTNECEHIAEVLRRAGILESVKTFKPKGKAYKGLRLDFSLEDAKPKFSEVKRISKPGRRLYYATGDLAKVSAQKGLLVVSTSKGIMSSFEARKRKLGGEVICQIY